MLGGLSLMTQATKAQESGAAPAEPKERLAAALETEKQIEQAKKDIAEAKRDALLAQLPSSETKGAAGTVTLNDKAGYFAELMAYGTLSTAAAQIAKGLGTGCGRTVVLTDQLELSQKVQLWRLIKTRLEAFNTRFKDLLDRTEDMKSAPDIAQVKALQAEVAALPAILGGVADIAAFFKVDREFIGRKVALAQNALLAEVAAKLKEKGWKVFLPSLDTSVTGALLQDLDQLADWRIRAARRRRNLETTLKPTLDDLQKKRKERDAKKATLEKLRKADTPDQEAIDRVIIEIKALNDQIEPLEKLEDRWKKLADEFDTLLAGYSEYEKTLTEGSLEKPSPVEALAIVDIIQSKSDAHRLFVGIVSHGAEIHITKSVWSGGRISYLGGSVCLYFWIDAEGIYQGSDSIPLWEGKSMKTKNGAEALNPKKSASDKDNAGIGEESGPAVPCASIEKIEARLE